jgi:hypothetical protein
LGVSFSHLIFSSLDWRFIGKFLLDPIFLVFPRW